MQIREEEEATAAAVRPDKEVSEEGRKEGGMRGREGYNQRDISLREEVETKQGQCLPFHTSTASTVKDLPLLRIWEYVHMRAYG